MTTKEDFRTRTAGWQSPATRLQNISPSDSVDLTVPIRGFIVSNAGNVNVIGLDDSSAVIIAVDANVIYPIACKRVLATSTTATGIVGLT